MELVLNITWMLLACATLCIWRTRWVHERNRTLPHSLREWTAVSVALILLFFAVSMSDDLHPEMMLFEDSARSRRSSSLSVDAHHSPLHSGSPRHTTVPAVVVALFAPENPRVSRTAVLDLEPAGLCFDGQSESCRAPPLSLL